MSAEHHHVHSILLKYLPATLAESALERALTECRLTRHSFERRHLPDVLAKLDPTIRLFVDPADQASVRADLEALSGRHVEKALSVMINEEPDISRARLLMRKVCTDLSLGAVITQKCVTIVSELARNIVSYTKGGTLEIEVAQESRRFRIRARDSGRGIRNIDEILSGSYRSKTGLGKGILGVKRLSERFDLKTGPMGTDVRVEVAW